MVSELDLNIPFIVFYSLYTKCKEVKFEKESIHYENYDITLAL